MPKLTFVGRRLSVVLPSAVVLIHFSFFLFPFLGCTEKVESPLDTRLLVRVGPVRENVSFAETLRVQGSVRTRDTASVAARVPGTVDELLVEEGQCVKKGTALFQVDRANLENAVRAAKDDLKMAQAKRLQAEVASRKATLDAERLARLFAGAAVTKDMLEKAEVGARSAAAALEAAVALCTKSETGLAVSEKNLADSRVTAPFDAVVTRKWKNVGDFAGPGAKVLDLENPSAREVCVTLNAAHYARVKTGKTVLRLKEPVDGKRDVVLTYRAPTVNPVTRTFEVRALLPQTESVAAGMLLDGEIVFAERKGRGLPASAVADRGGSDCVFAVRDGKVVRIPVKVGHETGGWREILSPEPDAAAKVVYEGMLLVNEGDEVRTQDAAL